MSMVGPRDSQSCRLAPLVVCVPRRDVTELLVSGTSAVLDRLPPPPGPVWLLFNDTMVPVWLCATRSAPAVLLLSVNAGSF